MNLIVRLALKIISMPVFDMTRDYEIVRRFQEWAASKEEIPENFILWDQELRAENGDHDIPVRLFISPEENAQGTTVFFHGGGYVIGNVDTYTPVCVQLVEETGTPVLSVDYRLAPEHPFPAGLDDCYEVLRFVCEDPSDRFRPITVIGDSAGGNLATVACQRLKKRGITLPEKQILLYPAVGWDYTENSPFESVNDKGESFGLTRKKLVEYYNLYIPEGVDQKNPEIAPLLSDDLSGLPDTLIITAEYDPLRDEAEFYAERLERAGVPVTLHRFPDVPHGFWTYERPFHEAVKRLYKTIQLFLSGGESR